MIRINNYFDMFFKFNEIQRTSDYSFQSNFHQKEIHFVNIISLIKVYYYFIFSLKFIYSYLTFNYYQNSLK